MPNGRTFRERVLRGRDKALIRRPSIVLQIGDTMNVIVDIIKKQKVSIAFTAVVLFVVSLAYFVWGTPYPGMTYVYRDASVYTDMKLKASYKDGALKVFALANPTALAAYRVSEGESVPGENTVIIGGAEAAMMRREGLFKRQGDTITGFFGIYPVVGGVLKRTYGLMDDMHFVTEPVYSRVQGEEGRLFIAFKDSRSPKFFFVLAVGEDPPIALPFAEGSLSDYSVREIGGKRYYPVILGADEAAMMKFEQLFKKPGDTIEGFFGVDIVITGVLAKTNSIVDMAHISPLMPADIK